MVRVKYPHFSRPEDVSYYEAVPGAVRPFCPVLAKPDSKYKNGDDMNAILRTLKPRLSLRTVVSAAVLLVTTQASYAIEKQTLQLATIEPTNTLWYRVADRFAKSVNERTDGKVRIVVSHSGTTGSVRESLEALQFGTNDIVQTVIASLDPYSPLAAIESYPYLFKDAGHFQRVMNGPVGKDLYTGLRSATGFQLLGAGFRGARELASKRPVESVDDLSGLKIRVPEIEIYRKTWSMLGASPVPMGSSEVYTGLQQGIIDAVENPLSAHIRSRYYEAADYLVMTGHVYSAYTFMLDGKRFEKFSPELQKILIEEGEEAMFWGGDEALREAESYEKTLIEKGVKVIRPDLAPFRAKLEPLKNHFPDLAPWVERISAAE